ncbi:MAG: signal peptidase I [Anaerococcus sp.]|nr:signal peptidase I [Anaerococcus sp.]
MKKNTSNQGQAPLDIIRYRKTKAIGRNYTYDLVEKIFLLGIFMIIILNFVFGIKIVDQDDMYPRISPMDLSVYYRLDRDFNSSEVVIFNKNDKDYLARVIAKGGDKVDLKEEGLYINGSLQAESNIFYQTGIYDEGIRFPINLKHGEYFLLGDNRRSAHDSRLFGPIKEKEIKGKIFTIIRRTQF